MEGVTSKGFRYSFDNGPRAADYIPYIRQGHKDETCLSCGTPLLGQRVVHWPAEGKLSLFRIPKGAATCHDCGIKDYREAMDDYEGKTKRDLNYKPQRGLFGITH